MHLLTLGGKPSNSEPVSKNKLQKFAENLVFEHVFEPTLEQLQQKQFPQRGHWRDVFGNDNPIVLELGCGKGEYSVGLGRKYPEKNFIGVDVKGARIWRGAKTVDEEQMSNVAFLRMRFSNSSKDGGATKI